MTPLLTRLITIYIPLAVLAFVAFVQHAQSQTATVDVSVRVEQTATLGVDPNELNQIEPESGEPIERVYVEVVEDEYGNLEVRF